MVTPYFAQCFFSWDELLGWPGLLVANLGALFWKLQWGHMPFVLEELWKKRWESFGKQKQQKNTLLPPKKETQEVFILKKKTTQLACRACIMYNFSYYVDIIYRISISYRRVLKQWSPMLGNMQVKLDSATDLHLESKMFSSFQLDVADWMLNYLGKIPGKHFCKLLAGNPFIVKEIAWGVFQGCVVIFLEVQVGSLNCSLFTIGVAASGCFFHFQFPPLKQPLCFFAFIYRFVFFILRCRNFFCSINLKSNMLQLRHQPLQTPKVPFRHFKPREVDNHTTLRVYLHVP